MDTEPLGKTIAIGGAEDREGACVVLSDIIDPTLGHKPKIVVVTSASRRPKQYQKEYSFALNKFDCEVTFVHFTTAKKADARKNLEKIEEADAVLFTGGCQVKLESRVAGTKFIDIIKHKRSTQKKFVVAGSSAGAMFMGQTMIYQYDGDEPNPVDKVQKAKAASILEDNIIIDTHFGKRNRKGRLSDTITQEKNALGIGLDEDTGAVFENDTVTCTGSGEIVFLYFENEIMVEQKLSAGKVFHLKDHSISNFKPIQLSA